jgi:hypothetical protein
MVVHRVEVRSGRLQIRQIQLLDVGNLSPERVHSFPDASVHEARLYLQVPKPKPNVVVLFGVTASASARDAMEQDSSDWRLFQIPSRWIR